MPTYNRRLERDFARSIRAHKDWPVVISEGDSWFSYPFERNVVERRAAVDKELAALRAAVEEQREQLDVMRQKAELLATTADPFRGRRRPAGPGGQAKSDTAGPSRRAFGSAGLMMPTMIGPGPRTTAYRAPQNAS